MASTSKTTNDGAASSAHGSYELVIAPLLFGLLGFWLDGVFGIRPVLTVVLAVLALVGVVAKIYYMYKAAMAAERARRVAAS